VEASALLAEAFPDLVLVTVCIQQEHAVVVKLRQEFVEGVDLDLESGAGVHRELR
jgi:hypothetical protein